MPENVRVRFAPAPTGYLHVGSARSALFNWLYARHHGGTFVLRIEDTNAELATPEYYAAITRPLEWLGIDWDEGPVYQSQRSEKYAAAIELMLDSGAAYLCDCTRDVIDPRNAASGFKGGYDGHCRERDVSDGAGVTVRFRTPDHGEMVIDDLVRGRVTFDNREFEDFVIRRGNGTPVFLVANAVDDADLGITHVVRGEDLLNTTPKVMLLWQALGFGEPPVYAHLPLLVGEDRKKLSKRKDSVALADFEAQGFLPEAMANYLALLGWGPPDDVEVRPMGEIIDLFDLADVNKAPAFFDMKKLEHINGEYIRALPTSELIERLQPWLGAEAPWPPDRFDPAVFEAVAPHVQERLRRLSDIGPLVDWLFTEEAAVETNEKELKAIAKAMGREEVPAVLDATIAALADCAWDADTLNEVVRSVGDDLGAKSQVPVRIAVSGRRVGPPLFEPMALLDRDLVLARLRPARHSSADRRDLTQWRHRESLFSMSGAEPSAPRSRRRLVVLIAAWVCGLAAVYVGITFVQVLHASRQDQARPVDAIVVLGAAQYDGRPSPVLEARLSTALRLYQEGLAPVIVTTGSNQEGDRFTQGFAGFTYLRDNGVPEEDLRIVVDGTNTFEELSATANVLREEALGETVLLVSDPYHTLRAREIAGEVGLEPYFSPTDLDSSFSQLIRETAAVSLGRVVGFRRVSNLS